MQHTYGLHIPRTLEEACVPSRTALIVYDMQVGILRQIAGAAAVTDAVSRLLQSARESGVRVFFMRHMSLPKELMGVTQLRAAMAWQRAATVDDVRPWFLRDSPGFQLAPELAPLPSEAVLDKITMSAFEGTPLDIALRDCGITTFIIAGVALEIGIEPTVRHGADLGYIPVVVTDAFGTGNQEAAERSLATLRFIGDAMFTTVEDLGRILHQGAAAQAAGSLLG
jgi:biuret amidohydrolase